MVRGGQLAQPDGYVVPLIEGRDPRHGDEYGIPLLVVEVLSPSSARYDRITKRRRYPRTGVGSSAALHRAPRAFRRGAGSGLTRQTTGARPSD